MSDLLSLSLSEARDKLVSKDVSAVELTEAYNGLTRYLGG